MKFVSRLLEQSGPLQKIFRQLLGDSPRKQQEKIDLYRAAVLLRGYAWHKKQNIGNVEHKDLPTEEDVKRFYAEVDELNAKQIASSVHKSLEEQIKNLLSKTAEYSAAVERVVTGSSPRSEAGVAKADLRRAVGFELECRKSTIPSAGDGVFVKGEVFPGTVVAFYPGLVHLAEYVSKKEYMKDLLPDDNFMLVVRNDGHVIDARTAPQVPYNPYALGHKINHVPAGEHPNCLQLAFDYPEDPLGIESFPHELRPYIPNTYAKRPSLFGSIDRSACMRGLVYIAARPLSTNDELFIDYRLNPFAGNLPEWYTPYDKEGASRRWDDEKKPPAAATDTTTTSSSKTEKST